MSTSIRVTSFSSKIRAKTFTPFTLSLVFMLALMLTDKGQICHADIKSLISNALVKQATQTLKIDSNQTIGGIGSILNMAGDNLTNKKFDLLKLAIPDASKLIAKAPASASAGSDFSSFSPENLLGSLGPITSQFASLGLDSDTILPLVNVVLNYLKSNKSTKAHDILESALPSALTEGTATKSLLNAL